MQYKLYGNVSNFVSNNGVNLNNKVLDLNKKDSIKLSQFFYDKVISVSDSNNVFGINEVNVSSVLIKPSYKVLDSNNTYSFDVKKSYVITVDKEVMDDIYKFYSMFIPIDNISLASDTIFDSNDIFKTNEVSENKDDVIIEINNNNNVVEENNDTQVIDNSNQVIFKADKETNLKEVFDNIESSTVVNNISESSNNDIIVNKEENKNTTSSDTSSKWLILICVLAGIALTVMGVFIAISIIRG